MRIVDSFIFLAEHETELMLLKFILEQDCVDRWVAVENCWTYRGDWKGPKLEKILEDERFAPFRDRVSVVTISNNPCPTGLPAGVDPPQCAQSEWSLRDAAAEATFSGMSDSDRVIVSDVDEMVDFSEPARRDKVFGAFKEHGDGAIQFDRVRYWWDFSNRSWREKMDMVTPSYSIGDLRTGRRRFHEKKWIGAEVHNGDIPAVFEYSFCFPLDGVYLKYSTSLHTCWSKKRIDESIACNYWTKADYQADPSPGCRWDWMETVTLTERNSPRYVRENLASLRTNLVPDNYRENRLLRFGHDGVHEANKNDM